MGKPFLEELYALEETYRWAICASAPQLRESLGRLTAAPLCAVGSGGSLTTAEIASELFSSLGFGLATTMTPAELASRGRILRGCSVFLATAGGSNPDALGSLRVAGTHEAGAVLALCATAGSKLAENAKRFSQVQTVDFDLPSGRDGFLATNSLLASATLLLAGFSDLAGVDARFPKKLSMVVGATNWRDFVRTHADDSEPLWSRETVLVLHTPSTRFAATDLESKLNEAALANCATADYRHFAHGRHHWLAKRGSSSSVVAFVPRNERTLAEKTLAELPPDVPRVVIPVHDGPVGMLAALAHVYPLVLGCGKARHIDPGRPGVPAFGRRIYRLNAFGRNTPPHRALPTPAEAAIERKSSKPRVRLEQNREYRFWSNAYRRSLDQINNGRYASIVFDYDGTLCSAEERLTGCRKPITDLLSWLLESGITVGIATGRGKSVGKALRGGLPKSQWNQVIVGYYNGGQIGTLANTAIPDGSASVDESFSLALKAIKRCKRLGKIAEIEPRKKQITVTVPSAHHRAECERLLLHCVNLTLAGRAKLVCSTHSFDVLPTDVTKLDVIRRVADPSGDTLAIGDMGLWPGNDHELLTHPYSLSVDQSSPDPSSGWNLAPPGVSGVDATLSYFSRAKLDAAGRLRVTVGKSPARSMQQ